jgi:hypothetical protein
MIVQPHLPVIDNLSSLECYNIEKYVHGFFRGAQLKDLRKGNLLSFLSWAMFAAPLAAVVTRPDDYAKINIAYDEVCERFNLDLPDGFNQNAQHVSMTLDQISYIHRPLCFYVVAGVTEILSTFFLFRLSGYQHLEMGGLRYWYRPNASTLPPIVLFHGITPGWLAYSKLVASLATDRTIFLVDIEPCKIKSLCFEIIHPKQFSNSIRLMLKRHGFDQASFVGHSFGTIIAGWVVKLHPDMVSHLTLLDPVSLLLGLPGMITF